MKKVVLRWIGRALVVGILAGAGWIVLFRSEWLRPVPLEEEPETVDTEVAVRVAPVVRATLRKLVDAYGTVLPAPGAEREAPASARVASPLAGIVAVSSAIEGNRVERGQRLFQLDDRLARSEEAKAQAALERAKVAAGFAERALDRQKRLMSENATAARRLEEAEAQLASARGELAAAEQVLSAARTARSLLAIAAPLSGTITHVRVNPGEAVDTTGPLAEIVDLDRLVVQASVPAPDAVLLAAGQPAEVRPRAAAGGVPIEGKLSFVGLDVDPRSDSVTARVVLPRGTRLRPDDYVRVRIVVEARLDRLAVPAECVCLDPEGKSVVSVVLDARATRRVVRTGLREGDLVEIEGEGLAEGVRVVTSGAYGLPAETKIRVLEQ